jgi:ribosome biogenesis GTPase
MKFYQKKLLKPAHHTPEKLLGTEREGLIVVHFGSHIELEDAAGNIFRCYLRKNLAPLITGDRVLWRLEPNNTVVIVRALPRKSLLARPENNSKTKLIAANVDVLVIVAASTPIFSEQLIDRYIVAAENVKIRPIILLNKIDLLDEKTLAALKKRLAIYETMGYLVIAASIYLEDGLKQLGEFLKNKTAMLVGASGVGKSSILATFTQHATIAINVVSAATGFGKHTTTMTRLYHLAQGGNLIDSPGVREFGLWNLRPQEILQGFIDFHPFLGQCKFRDCQHQKEPGCALQQAVINKKINLERWESYNKIIHSLER